jgi:hypothetical protein
MGSRLQLDSLPDVGTTRARRDWGIEHVCSSLGRIRDRHLIHASSGEQNDGDLNHSQKEYANELDMRTVHNIAFSST